MLLHQGYDLVKGRAFNSWRRVGHVLQSARIHEARGVDELVVLDVSASKEGRGPNVKLIQEITRSCFMPLTVGGGVSTVAHIRELLRAGADKVVIGTAAQERPAFITEASDKFGAQCVTVAIDVRSDGLVWAYSASRRLDRRDPVEWAEEVVSLGAGEIIVNAVERDGTMEGYDLDLIRRVSAAVRVPVIAAGGCSGYRDMAKALRAGAHAVSAGALFLFQDATPRGAAEYLAGEGYPMRRAA